LSAEVNVRNQNEWNIKSRSDVCQSCGKEFEDKEAFYSRLEFGAEGYERQDLCEACWTDEVKQGALSFWKSEFRVPPPPPPEALRKETAESLLRKLMETEDAKNLNTIYILTVMLERKRILVERDVQVRDDGIKVRMYEHRKTGETFLISDPGLKLAELESVQEEVVVMLGGKKPGEDQEREETDGETVKEEGAQEGKGEASG